MGRKTNPNPKELAINSKLLGHMEAVDRIGSFSIQMLL